VRDSTMEQCGPTSSGLRGEPPRQLHDTIRLEVFTQLPHLQATHHKLLSRHCDATISV
jgi:hypothetical protein